MATEIKTLQKQQLSEAIVVIVGTRPGIVMFAPIIDELRKRELDHIIIHTGQHYSANMDDQFFLDLNLPKPHYKLKDISSSPTHGGQTAKMLEGIEQILLEKRPRLVLVGGDANTNLAAALAARKLGIAVGHVEAGERSFDWRMPEEHNRRMIDHISDHLYATGDKAKAQLEKESIQGRIFVTGNPIVDASLQHAKIAATQSEILQSLELTKNDYFLLTTHREENVDVEAHLRGILQGVAESSQRIGKPVIFPVHPRTQKRLHEFGMEAWLESLTSIRCIDAVGYLDFLQLLTNSSMVFTDSGGVQQEACIHRVPAVTVRENTEWVETIDVGANCLAGADPNRIKALAEVMWQKPRDWRSPFGEEASTKIVDCALEYVSQ